jgi:cytochrome P450
MPMTLESQLRTARFLANPYALFAELRSREPVRWNAHFNCWTVTRHADIMRILDDAVASSARRAPSTMPGPGAVQTAAGTLHDRLAHWMIRLDPPSHTRLRSLISRALTRGTVAAVKPAIELKAQQLLEAGQLHGGMDLISEFAAPLVLHAIASLIGLPPADHLKFKQWSDDIGAFAEGETAERGVLQAARSMQEVTSYLNESIRERHRQPQPDLLTRLVSVSRDGDRLADSEVVDASALLLLAGHETTTHAIASAMAHIFRQPELRQLLPSELGGRERAIDEFLRLDSPLLGVLRRASNELIVGDTRIEPGHNILLWLASGNHDESVFEDPELLLLRRARTAHLAFGHGSHACLGASLARVTMEIGMRSLLQGAAQLRPAGEATVWQGNALFRQLRALPVWL